MNETSVSETDAYVSWKSALQTMKITFSKTLIAKSVCTIVIGSNPNDDFISFKVPIQGFPMGDYSGFTIMTNALEGPVGKTLFLGNAGIGAFRNSSLSYSAGEGIETKAHIKFIVTMGLSPGDTVTLFLPPFTGSSTKCVQILESNSLPRGAVVSTGWNFNTAALTLTLARYFPAETEIEVTVPPDAGLILPYAGLQTNQETLTIRAEAASSTAETVPISISAPIGSFLFSPKIAYDPPVAGSTTTLIFSFRPMMDILSQETITLTLPNFESLKEEMAVQTDPFEFRNAISRARWSNLTSELTMSINNNNIISSNQTIKVTFEADTISLPAKGLEANQASLKLKTNAIRGPNPGVSISSSPAVGSFYSNEQLPYLSFDFVDYECAFKEAGNLGIPKACLTLKLEFMTTMPLEIGERLLLFLPGFSSAKNLANLAVTLDDSSAPQFSAHWNQAGNILEFIWKIPVASFVRYTVTVSSMNGLQLPPHGVRLNDDDLSMSCNAQAGPVPKIPIHFTEAIGVFDIKKVEFEPAIAGMPTNTTISFQLNRAILPGDSILIVFTSRLGLSNADRCTPFFFPEKAFDASSQFPRLLIENVDPYIPFPFIEFDVPEGVTKEARRMTLKAQKRIEANIVTTIKIPSFGTEGIILPDCGFSTTTQTMKISTNAMYGQVQGSTLDMTSLGSFRKTSIDYELPKAGFESLLSIKFRITMRLKKTSSVTMDLPGFSRSSRAIDRMCEERRTKEPYSCTWSCESKRNITCAIVVEGKLSINNTICEVQGAGKCLGSDVGTFDISSTSPCCRTGSCIATGKWLDTSNYQALSLYVREDIGY